MNTVVLQLAMTIDGYIARQDGSVDFLGDMSVEITDMFDAFVRTIDTIVMGRSTYDQMLGFGEIPFTDKRIVVLSSRPLRTHPNHVERFDGDASTLFDTLVGRVWLFGGASVIRDCMNQNLIDEMELLVVPVVLGDGIPLCAGSQTRDHWHLRRSKTYQDHILLHYQNNQSK